MPRKRIDWTDFEQGEVYNGVMDLIKLQKLPLPVPPGKGGAQFLNLIRQAQIKLQPQRQRPLNNIEAISGMAQRFIDHGVIPKNYLDVYRRSPRKQEVEMESVEAPPPDPRDEQLKQLGEELEHWKLRARNAESTVRTWEALPKPPTEAQVIKSFISDILAEASRKGSQGLLGPLTEFKPPPKLELPKEFLPDFEKERRLRGSEPVSEDRQRLPKIAVVGGDQMHTALAQELKDIADLRFFPTRQGGDDHIGERLKAFKDSTYGKVVLWTNYTSHQAGKSMQHQNIPYVSYMGERGGMIAKLKELAKDAPK